jgi:hypothetical protein
MVMLMAAYLAALLCSKQKEEEEKVMVMGLPSFARAVAEEVGEWAVARSTAQGPRWQQRGFVPKENRS